MKSIALGLCQEKGSYLCNNWNILDFLVVLSSVINMLIVKKNIFFIKVLILYLGYKNVKNFKAFKIYKYKSLNEINGE